MNCREAHPNHPPTAAFVPQDTILLTGCPRCFAAPGDICPRKHGRSHVERLWLAQGHLPCCLPWLSGRVVTLRSRKVVGGAA